MRRNNITVSIITLIITILISWQPISAGGEKDLTVEEYRKIARGGLLYDKWYSILEVKTEGTHPSYPAEGKKNGESTWRCKECHGWDYKGREGAYSGGSHYTGIKGIRDFVSRKPGDVMKVLNDKNHSIGKIASAGTLEEIAFFVSYGQLDMDAYIDRKTKKVSGNLSNGEKIFLSTCAKCHGEDGKKINFKPDEKPEYLGTLANKNPWETLHKLRFGQPTSNMISMLFVDIRDQVDVLSYSQTLPVK
jgi:thiosulfate dehydrogenase